MPYLPTATDGMYKATDGKIEGIISSNQYDLPSTWLKLAVVNSRSSSTWVLIHRYRIVVSFVIFMN